MNEPKTPDEEWDRLVRLLHSEVDTVSARGIMEPPEFCVALIHTATSVALTCISEREEVFKLLLGAMDSTMQRFDEQETENEEKKQKPQDSPDNAPTE